MGRIRRDSRDSRKWMIDTTVTFPDGTRKHLTKRGYWSKGTADKAYPGVEAEFIAKSGFKPKRQTIDALVEDYFAWKSERVRRSTLNGVKLTINKHFRNFFRGHQVTAVYTIGFLQKFRKYVIHLPHTQTRRNVIFKMVSDLTEYAATRKIISSDMWLLSKMYTESIRGQDDQKKQYSIWSHEQYKSFIDTFSDNDKYKVLFQWMFFSGARIGEVRALQWGDYDPVNKRIWINKSASSKFGDSGVEITSTKTKAGNRYVYLSDAMNSHLSELRNHFFEGDNSFLFFGNEKPIGHSTVTRIFKEHTKIAKLPPMKIHEIRHTNTTWLIRNQVSREEEQAIKRRQGHSSLSMTVGVYFHHDEKKEKEIAEKIVI